MTEYTEEAGSGGKVKYREFVEDLKIFDYERATNSRDIGGSASE